MNRKEYKRIKHITCEHDLIWEQFSWIASIVILLLFFKYM